MLETVLENETLLGNVQVVLFFGVIRDAGRFMMTSQVVYTHILR